MNDTVQIRRGRRKTSSKTGCAVEATLSVIGGVWKPVLLFHLLEGKLRFNALCRRAPSATPRMVTLQLRELEADGIIRRTVYPEVPPRVEYELTDLGRSLQPLLLDMRAWGQRFQSSCAEVAESEAAGGPDSRQAIRREDTAHSVLPPY